MMRRFNQFWSNIWIFTIIIMCVKCITKPRFTEFIQEKYPEWIDEKGLLKFLEEELVLQNCESCSNMSRVYTEESQVCYTQESGVRKQELTSICDWPEDSSSETSETYSIRTFSFIQGLKVLSLTKYKIETWINIDTTFVGLTDLQHLYLENNHITGWNVSGTQETLTNLKVLSLANNPITTLSENSFTWLKGSKLEYLNLRGCSKMKILDSAVFNPLRGSQNMWLDLSYTILEPGDLSNLTASFENENELSVLSLAHTGLYKIPREALEKIAHSLQRLSLQGNYFSNCRHISNEDNDDDLDDCLFPEDMAKLKEINLKDSELSDFPFEAVLNAAKNLEALYLDDNPLQEMSCSEVSNVAYISLRNIKSEKGFSLCANGSKCAFPGLRILDLSDTLINMSLSNFSDLKSLQYLSLRNSVTNYVLDSFRPLENLKFFDLSDNMLNISLLNASFTGLTKLEVLLLESSFIYINSASASASPFLNLTSLKILDLRHNFIRYLTENLLKGLQKLQKLILRGNRIRTWKQNVFKNLHLKNLTLDLQSNWITDITSSMVTDFAYIEEMDISNNPISCESCEVAKFFENCETKPDTSGSCNYNGFNITLLNWKQLMTYECSIGSEETIPLSELRSDNVCPIQNGTEIQTNANSGDETYYTYYFWISVAIIPIVGGLCYWKRWKIILYVRMFRRKMEFNMLKDPHTKKGKKETYQYDVFLSYSDRDREWILQQLIPNIEQRGHIKVCLHERDFEAGLPVLENIIACMDHSRCVLLVLSEAFLRSHWCQFELNLAQHRLLEMQHDRLILVLLENIPRDKCSKMLRYLMLTKTYVVWPDKGSNEETNLFWKKLKKAIGPVQDTMNVSFA